jgi:hypothetical protein
MCLLCFTTVCVSACDRREAFGPKTTGASTSDDPLPGQPAYCDGLCVATPPATYTGPSLFWIGLANLAEGCPPETPETGIEGYVPQQMPLVFARECRVTPSDLCAEEGQTCSPLPRPEFHVCIHRLGPAACPPDYTQHTTMNQIGTDIPVTVCCQKSPVPG